MRTSRTITLVLLSATFLPVSAAAQDGWKNKPYQQWTKDDIIKVGSDSPWARVQQATPAVGERVPSYAEPAVTIRLRSAMPIREALVRLREINAHYDKMSDKDRAAFNQKTKGTLECPACANNYIVSMGPPVTNRVTKSGIGSLRKMLLSQLQSRVYLQNERGERRELVHFVAPTTDDGEAMFFFSRFDEKGQPLLTLENKKLILLIDVRSISFVEGLGSLPERVEFDVNRMIVDGKVDF